jgi:hypothetical protein
MSATIGGALYPGHAAPRPLSQPQPSSVHRYFPLADSFVEVRQLGVETQVVDAPHGLDRVGYRRFVIRACMPQFTDEVADELAALFPEDPEGAENLLYDLCIEVNPALDIHRVNLRTPGAQAQAASRRRQVDASAGDPTLRLAGIIRDLERKLKARLHGQDAAVERLCRAVEKAAAGLSAPNRPLGSFLLVGRTGTGKTEITRQLAAILAGEGEWGREPDPCRLQ